MEAYTTGSLEISVRAIGKRNIWFVSDKTKSDRGATDEFAEIECPWPHTALRALWKAIDDDNIEVLSSLVSALPRIEMHNCLQMQDTFIICLVHNLDDRWVSQLH